VAESSQNNQEQTTGRVYPNPFTDYINFDFYNTSSTNKISADVYDLAGRLILRRQYQNLGAGNNTVRVNVFKGNLKTGIYIVRLKINGTTIQAAKMVRTKK
jgi:hypothetical protein